MGSCSGTLGALCDSDKIRGIHTATGLRVAEG